MTDTKYTPTPWEVGTDPEGLVAVLKNGTFITYAFPTDMGLEGGCEKANAAHIVKCVNMHDELVEVIKAFGNEKISDAEFNIMRNESLKKVGAL